MSTKVVFLDPREIEETLAEVARTAARYGGDPLVVVGGVAMMSHGSDRLTKDVDLASLSPLSGEQVKRLSFGGHVTRLPSGRIVDVIVREDEYADLYADAIGCAVDLGLPLPVASPHHLLALKMAAAREKDHLDVKTLLHLDVVDRRLARAVVHKYLGPYAARELDSVCDEVEWEKSRGVTP